MGRLLIPKGVRPVTIRRPPVPQTGVLPTELLTPYGLLKIESPRTDYVSAALTRNAVGFIVAVFCCQIDEKMIKITRP